MAFTTAELENIANSTLEYHMKNVHSSAIQSKPLLKALEGNKKTFSGGRGLIITERVKGVYTSTMQGYTHNDTVGYANPANIKVAQYVGKELHVGITVTMTELKQNGISVVDSENGRNTSGPSDGEMFQLVDLLEDKLEDMTEGSMQDFHRMLWLDGTQDAKELAGIGSILLNTPGAAGATIGGINTNLAANAWFRNRTVLDINTGTTKIADVLQKEFRQLHRYKNGSLKHRIFCGSDFLDAVEKELRADGTYTDTGWAKTAGLDMSIGDAKFKGVTLEYDPALDDLSRAKFCYVIDMNAIRLRPMAGEEYKKHSPARPETVYAIYRATTWTGALTSRQNNTSGVYSIA